MDHLNERPDGLRFSTFGISTNSDRMSIRSSLVIGILAGTYSVIKLA